MKKKKPGPIAGRPTAERYFMYDGDYNDAVWFAEKYNIEYHTLKKRLARGWSIERALTEPLQERKSNVKNR